MEYTFTHGALCVTATSVYARTWHVQLFCTVLMNCNEARVLNEGAATLNNLVLTRSTLRGWLLIKTFGLGNYHSNAMYTQMHKSWPYESIPTDHVWVQ